MRTTLKLIFLVTLLFVFMLPIASSLAFTSEDYRGTQDDDYIEIIDEKEEMSIYSLPYIGIQCSGHVAGGDCVVFTGPGRNYYRTASGRAYLENYEGMNILGIENGWYLILYNGQDNGRRIVRCSFIPEDCAIPNSQWVNELEYAWLPIYINSGAYMADSPTYGHAFNTIEVDRSSAVALAQIEADEESWIYFEAIGRAKTEYQNGRVLVRGFVPTYQVSKR